MARKRTCQKTIQSSSKEIDYCTYTRLFFRFKCTKYYNYSNSYDLTFTCMNHLYLDIKTKSNTIKYSVDKKLLDCPLSMLRKSPMIILRYILVSLQIYYGNNDQNGVVVNTFITPIEARFVRLYPYAWHVHISLRMELYGCSLKPGLPSGDYHNIYSRFNFFCNLRSVFIVFGFRVQIRTGRV